MRLWIAMLGAILTATAPAHAQFANDSELLIKAVRESDGAKVESLIGNSRSDLINLRAYDGSTPLTIAVEQRNQNFVNYLLGKGADPNLAGHAGTTPLVSAAQLGWFDGVDLLLKAGAKVDVPNRQGETALIVAVQVRNLPIVRRLLQAGADPDRTDHAAGMSAREYAQRDNRVRDTLRLIETVRPTKPAH